MLALLAVAGLAAAGARGPEARDEDAARAPATQEAPPSPADAGPPESAAARALREGRPIDVNAASAEDLRLLPGIGPALSARIVASRREQGPFSSVEALRRVRGIGPKTVARLAPLLRVDRPAAGLDGRDPDGGPSLARPAVVQ